jgi:uncharacterized protein (DUF433 family)
MKRWVREVRSEPALDQEMSVAGERLACGGKWLSRKSHLSLATAGHMRDNQSRKQGMLDWTTCGVVERHTARVSGAWVFRGTRVPVSALFANLEGGATVEEFLEWFPGVSREQVNGVLEHAAHSLATPEAA